MVKSLNMYRVKDRNWTFASGIRSIDDLQAVIAHCLESRGMDETSAKSLSSDPALFFKPNKHDILVHVYPSGQIADVGKQSGSVNNVLTRLRIFNGRALRHNSPESFKQRYKHGGFEPKEVKFAESAIHSGGFKSVIFSQTKRQKNHDVIDTETYEKVQKLTPQGYFDVKMAVSDVIEKLLKTMKPCDVYRKLKGKCNMGSNELNRLIFKLSRA
jgi:hypothetical protein